MSTVSYSCPTSGKKMKKSFPYNAVGKAQAVEFAKMNKGSIKNNPGPGTESQTPKPNQKKKQKPKPSGTVVTEGGVEYRQIGKNRYPIIRK